MQAGFDQLKRYLLPLPNQGFLHRELLATFHGNLVGHTSYNSGLDQFSTVSFIHQVGLKLPHFNVLNLLVPPDG